MQVVDVDNVRQRVTVKLIPRIDMQALANKLVNISNVTLGFYKYLRFILSPCSSQSTQVYVLMWVPQLDDH